MVGANLLKRSPWSEQRTARAASISAFNARCGGSSGGKHMQFSSGKTLEHLFGVEDKNPCACPVFSFHAHMVDVQAVAIHGGRTICG